MTRTPNGARRLLSLLVTAGLAAGVTAVAVPVASAATAPAPVVTPGSTAALAQDAPDPDIVRVGSTFYAFTTGTTWGNQIGIARSTAADPSTGWMVLGSAFPANGDKAPPASWERNNTPTSPGVFQHDGKWIMFYDAVDNANGLYCLSVATASTVTGPYADTSSGPLYCQTTLGGSIDPQPFVDPQTGGAYLLWKNNAGGSSAASRVWSVPLAGDGMSFAGAPTAIFTIESATYPWQTTTDDPSMVYAGGHDYLFFSGGDWQSSDYPVGYVLCGSGPRGGCDQNEPSDPILKGAGGTGGGMEFTDATGKWWITYQTWQPSGCTHYPAPCERQMFVAPISLPPSTPSITTTALPKAPLNSPYDQVLTVAGGTAPYTWSISGGTLPAGLTLDAPSGAVTGTPTVAGTQSVTFQVTDAGKLTATAAVPVVVVPPDPYSPLAPVRICDTRSGNPSGLSRAAAQCDGTGNAGTTLGARGSRTIDVGGSFGVPADTTAVVLNVTMVGPAAAGYLAVYPAGATRSFASNVNYVKGQVVPNLVEVGAGAGGAVTVFSVARADVVVDVEGYVSPTASGGSGAGLYQPLASPLRICDTRAGNPSTLTGPAAGNCSGAGGTAGSTLSAGGTQSVAVAGAFGIPAGATAAVFNVTVVNPAATGFLTVYPSGTTRPFASNVNYDARQVTANRVVAPLSGGATPGRISVYSLARADVVVDVSGYFTAAGAGAGSAFSAEPAPVRVCDTRAGNPSALTGAEAQCNDQTIGTGGTRTVQVRGLAGVPVGATAVVVDLTAVAPTATTFLTVFPGPTKPFVSDLNPDTGGTRANLVVATLASDGTISIFNNAGSTDAVVDVEGWYS